MEDAGGALRTPIAADLALETFVVEHYDRLLRLARLICRDATDATDAVQAGLHDFGPMAMFLERHQPVGVHP